MRDMSTHHDIDRTALSIAAMTAILWGLTGVFVRLLPPLSPVTITASRLLISLAIAVVFLLLMRNVRSSFIKSLHIPAAYLLALLLGAYYFLATAAFQLAPVAEVALLLSTPPLFVLLLRRLRGDHPSRQEVGGALLAVAGIALIMTPGLLGGATLHEARLHGDLLAICAALMTGVYAFYYRCLAQQQRAPDSIGVTVLTFALGSVILVAVMLVQPGSAAFAPVPDTLLKMAGLGILATALPSLGFAIAAKRLPAVATATIALFIPVFATLFAWWILEERLSPMLLPGGALVLGGVAMILYRGKSAKPM